MAWAKASVVAGWDNQAVLAVADGFAHAFHVGGHYRHAGSHGFQEHHGQSFAEQAGENEKVHREKF